MTYRRRKAIHDKERNRVQRFRRRSPGLCVGCLQFKKYLYFEPYSGKYYCYECKREKS